MFHPIDPATWPRSQIFYYFSQMAPTGYSLTADLDVTAFYTTVKARGYRFFPSYLWLITKNINEQIEFKCALKDGILGYFDTLCPLYANFHEDDKTISFQWTEYTDDFAKFHADYLKNQSEHRDIHGVLGQPGTPPENAYTVSALPWVNFSHFSVISYENKPYYFPSIEAGKFVERDGRRVMPLSLTCHHATTDGYHIAKFLASLQRDMDGFKAFIN